MEDISNIAGVNQSTDESGSTDMPSQGGDTSVELQDRMSDGNVDAWLSPSQGGVITQDGDLILDKDGNPFDSVEAYLKAKKEEEEEGNADVSGQIVEPHATKTTTAQQQITPEKLFQMFDYGRDYSYKNEAALTIESTPEPTPEPVDYMTQIESDKKMWSETMSSPINDIKTALVNQGADPELVDRIISPIMANHNKDIDLYYQKKLTDAMREDIAKPVQEMLKKAEREKLSNASKVNVERLAKKYFPEGGISELFARIDGVQSDSGFTRGESAHIVDMLVKVSNAGKKFNTNEEMLDAYKNSFIDITSNEGMANALFDIMHYYFIGKNSGGIRDYGKKEGVAQASAENKRKQSLIKPRLSAFSSGSDDDSLPDMLRSALNQR